VDKGKKRYTEKATVGPRLKMDKISDGGGRVAESPGCVGLQYPAKSRDETKNKNKRILLDIGFPAETGQKPGLLIAHRVLPEKQFGWRRGPPG